MGKQLPTLGRNKIPYVFPVGGNGTTWTVSSGSLPLSSGTTVGDLFAMTPPATAGSNFNCNQWPVFVWVWDGTAWDLVLAGHGLTSDGWGYSSLFDDLTKFGVTESGFDGDSLTMSIGSSLSYAGLAVPYN